MMEEIETDKRKEKIKRRKEKDEGCWFIIEEECEW
jgi:hypothetical protein